MSTALHRSDQRWFVCPDRRPLATSRLLCLPPAGGGAALYRSWLPHLPSHLELTILQLPGRESRIREQPYTRLAPLIADLVEALAPQLHRPYALFGHSMGALVAFELARALRQAGAPTPACLVVSGRRPPHVLDPDPPLHALPEDAFVDGMARRYNGIPAAILADDDLKRLFLPTLRADLAVIETYRYVAAPPLTCPVVALGGQHDRRVALDDLRAWQAQTTADCRVAQLPGDHFYLQSASAAIVATIVSALDLLMVR